MTDATTRIIRAAVEGDPTLTPEARRAWLAVLTSNPEQKGETNKLITFKEAGRLLSLCPRSGRALADRGALTRVHMPGRRRARHVRLADVERLMQGVQS